MGLRAVAKAPDSLKAPAIGLTAYSLLLWSRIRIRTFASEMYFADGVGEKIERYINEFLPKVGEPARTSQEIDWWMEDGYAQELLYWEIADQLDQYELDEMKTQLDKDIVTLGKGYVPCVSAWDDFRRMINGGSPNYTMKQVDSFDSSEVQGADWSFLNIFFLRYGSSAYKLKMMKMIVLRKVLEFLY